MDIDQRIDTLEQRLSAMERKSRAWRILALLLLVALIGCLQSEDLPVNTSQAAAEKTPKEKVAKFDVIEVKKIRMVDNTRRVESEFVAGSIHLGTLDEKTIIFANVIDGSTPGQIHDNLAHLYVSNLNSPHTHFEVMGIGQTAIHGGLIEMRNQRDVTELEALSNEKLVDGKTVTLTSSKSRRYDELVTKEADIVIAPHRHGGGMITINNPLGESAVNLQSNKLNEGMISVFDVNGKVSRTLTAR